MASRDKYFDDDPLWYKDAIIYELHVKSFYDSNDDGIGDFRGLIQKLDYLEGLGITAIWILPFYPSPLKDDGYDISYYFNVNPNYGTLRDFRDLLREAHKRGIRVITELVLNHTSDQHPWFQRARRARPGTVWRDFYVWSDTPEKYRDARIIFGDFETSNWSWDPVAKAYYWHRFYSHQPDLNFENPYVQKSMFKIVDNWLNAGVDGLRLDAVPYLYESEGTNCENLPETHEFLKKLRRHVDEKFKNRMFLGEANQWPEDAAAYFGNGDECHMAFHFPLMPRIFMALQMEDRFPVIDILEQTPDIPESCQWGLFLRNHDELTLEMVTDEERDYMYRVYARDPRTRINLGIRRRLAPLVGNNRRKIEIMTILLFSLPGTPIIYYGDEVAMGDNYYLGDRDGVRTPMQWSSDRNAGFSRTNPHKLYLPVIIDPEYHYEALNVENQESNPSSLLWWLKRVITMRKMHKAFSRGTIEFPGSDNPKVIVITRRYQDETILVVINLSRFSQVVEIDLAGHAGYVPIEVSSQNRFPVIRETPYVLTMGFYDYYWFLLEKEKEEVTAAEERVFPELSVKKIWTNVLEGKARERLEGPVLKDYLKNVRWFGGKARTFRKIKILEQIPLEAGSDLPVFVFLETHYSEGPPEGYILPLAYASEERSLQVMEEFPRSIIARLSVDEEQGILFDGSYEERLRENLLQMIARRKKKKGRFGELTAFPGRKFRDILSGRELPLASQVLKAEQTNTSIFYENIFLLKMYRRLSEGTNPDSEITRFLSERAGFTNVPPFAGAIEYHRKGFEPVTICQLQGFVPNQGDAWTYTVDAVRHYYEHVLSKQAEIQEVPSVGPSLYDIYYPDIPPLLQELIGGVYLEMAILLGKRTGELHLALASATGERFFEPEAFSMLYQRSLYQSMRNMSRRVMLLLGKNVRTLPENVRDEASGILRSEPEILKRFQRILGKKISTIKCRYHGDFHLGQVLYTGKDFVIIDFEGEPARAVSERRLKRSPIRDVAGMIRSFHYSVHSALLQHGKVRPEDVPLLEPWAGFWYHYVSGIFLSSYLHTTEAAPFIPPERNEFGTLLECFLLEKAVYELGYELNNRPEWVVIPARGIMHILQISESEER
jgi:maltose alpha-D-glucosyltransferase/alpha-amylase